MRKGSKILLIVAGVLVVSGIIVAVIGGIMAKSQNIELLCDEIVDEDAITTEELSDYGITSCKIDVDGVGVKIEGNCERSYVEFININRAKYNFTIKNHQLVINTINPFNITDIWETYVYNIRENKGGFDGLRHYVFLGKYGDKTPQINIYLSSEAKLEDIVADVENAGLFVTNNFSTNTNYSLSVKNGNLTAMKLYSFGKLSTTTENGKLTLTRTNVANIKVDTINAPVNINYNKQMNYSLTSAGGTIMLDSVDIGNVISEYYPPTVSADKTSTDAPVVVEGTVVNGDILINEYSE